METTASPRDMASPRDKQRSFVALFSDLWRETTTLVHDEAELAKADLTDKVSQAMRASGSIAVGGAVAFAGFLVLLMAAVNVLARGLPAEHAAWLSPLIVGLVVLAIGWFALSRGRRKLQADSLTPARTLQSLREDQRMVKEHFR